MQKCGQTTIGSSRVYSQYKTAIRALAIVLFGRGSAARILWAALLLSVVLHPQPLGAAGTLHSQPATLQPHVNLLYLPTLETRPSLSHTGACPRQSAAVYGTVPTQGTLDRPAATNPDLNLAVRGYSLTAAPLTLIDWGGATDALAPQMTTIFAERRAAAFTAAYRVNDWDWACGTDGCRGQSIPHWPVTLVGLDSRPGEAIFSPARAPQIYNGGYIALVLYADETRLTLTYTRDNSPARGYVVHLEDLCVDPNLLALYRVQDTAGRQALPALRPHDAVGTAGTISLKVAIRDEGSFLDPRSRKDWWQ